MFPDLYDSEESWTFPCPIDLPTVILWCLLISHDVHTSGFRGRNETTALFFCAVKPRHNLLHEQTLPRMSFCSANRDSSRIMELPDTEARLPQIDGHATKPGQASWSEHFPHRYLLWHQVLGSQSYVGVGRDVTEPGKWSQVLGTRFNIICHACIPNSPEPSSLTAETLCFRF